MIIPENKKLRAVSETLAISPFALPARISFFAPRSASCERLARPRGRRNGLAARDEARGKGLYRSCASSLSLPLSLSKRSATRQDDAVSLADDCCVPAPSKCRPTWPIRASPSFGISRARAGSSASSQPKASARCTAAIGDRDLANTVMQAFGK